MVCKWLWVFNVLVHSSVLIFKVFDMVRSTGILQYVDFPVFNVLESASTFQHINVRVFNLLGSADTLKASNFQVFDQVESPSTYQHVNFRIFGVLASPFSNLFKLLLEWCHTQNMPFVMSLTVTWITSTSNTVTSSLLWYLMLYNTSMINVS